MPTDSPRTDRTESGGSDRRNEQSVPWTLFVLQAIDRHRSGPLPWATIRKALTNNFGVRSPRSVREVLEAYGLIEVEVRPNPEFPDTPSLHLELTATGRQLLRRVSQRSAG